MGFRDKIVGQAQFFLAQTHGQSQKLGIENRRHQRVGGGGVRLLDRIELHLAIRAGRYHHPGAGGSGIIEFVMHQGQ